MSDYISREETLERLCKDVCNVSDCQCDEIRCEEWFVIHNVPAADVRPARWIPTSERLPEAGGTYLCVWQGKTVDTGFFCNGHFRLYGEIKDHLITHWMPLPELPSVNGKETEHDPEREG
jgi:hypothetical protein